MFTGIVETLGKVLNVSQMDDTKSGGSGYSISIGNAAIILSDCHDGDSISVNGVCLTVCEFDTDSFKVGVSPETLRKTNLGELKIGEQVCLERAMKGDGRFGGHVVQGHVDCTCKIVAVEDDPPNSLIFTLSPPEEYMTYIVPKGYVCLDGASLTVVSTDAKSFKVMLIAYTRERIVLAKKLVGDSVNLEVDGMGKYVENIVKGMLQGSLKSLIKSQVQDILNEKQ